MGGSIAWASRCVCATLAPPYFTAIITLKGIWILALEGKRPAAPPMRRTVQVLGEERSGSNSSMRLFGQVGNFSSVSVSQAYGSN